MCIRDRSAAKQIEFLKALKPQKDLSRLEDLFGALGAVGCIDSRLLEFFRPNSLLLEGCHPYRNDVDKVNRAIVSIQLIPDLAVEVNRTHSSWQFAGFNVAPELVDGLVDAVNSLPPRWDATDTADIKTDKAKKTKKKREASAAARVCGKFVLDELRKDPTNTRKQLVSDWIETKGGNWEGKPISQSSIERMLQENPELWKPADM